MDRFAQLVDAVDHVGQRLVQAVSENPSIRFASSQSARS